MYTVKKYPVGLLEKMNRIMKSIDRIAKDRKNTNANYMYASEKAIKEAMHKAFAHEGIVFKLDVLDAQYMEMQSGKGITKIKTQYAFIDCDTGECIDGSFVGSGNGRDDKGIYAAVTGSLKYILTSTFMIPTGDDPEDDRYEYEPPAERETKKKPEPVEEPAEKEDKAGNTCTDKPKPKPKSAAAKPPSSTSNDNVRLTEDQQNLIINHFEKAGIEIWDLEKVAGDRKGWTFADRRSLLKRYNALTSKSVEYTAEDFLAGKTV